MTFFSTLFNIKKSLMLANPVFNETHLQSPDFAEDDIDTEKWEYKVTKFISLYQIIFYIFHTRKKKWPMTGLKKIGARSCRAPIVLQTSIGGARIIMHQHYFSW